MKSLLVALVTFVAISAAAILAQQPPSSSTARAEQAIASWKAKPAEVARTMIKKYGQPQEVTSNRLVWHNNGPWKFSELVNEEIPHSFPMPHADMLYQSIAYRIEPDKADELIQYDGSVILERTKGEIAARCDKEEANFLAINLAHDIATGKRSVDDARRFYAESIQAMMKTGKPNEYLQGFNFTPPSGDQGDRDKPFGPIGTPGKD
ncbi:MAG: hypothetical protein LC753_04320 [Acidobacteria bacterium]|nr:hypothetical protein [Acidobacteriota bacterium]MCA1649524.1 hypothetical protein [Acidobacteriota bacterium]